MDLFEAFQKRHSYRRNYLDKPIPRGDLRKIVEAGTEAPSGCNAQTTSFVIVGTMRKVLNRIGEVLARKCQAMIVCVLDPTPAHDTTSYGLEDCAAAVENMLLSITALGYATVWLDRSASPPWDRGANRGDPRRSAGKARTSRAPLGIPAEEGTQNERRPFSERAWFNKYGG